MNQRQNQETSTEFRTHNHTRTTSIQNTATKNHDLIPSNRESTRQNQDMSQAANCNGRDTSSVAE